MSTVVTMTEVSVTDDRPKRGNGAAAHNPVLVSGNKLAVHFGCSRQNVDQLATQGVIERRSDGLFDQDASRLKYIARLRDEHRRSPRTQADADHVAVKTEMLQLRLMEKRRELVRRSDVDGLIDDRHADHIVKPACAVCTAWRSCDPAQHRASRVRGAHRVGQGLP